MKFKALVSPKQFASYKGQVLKANDGYLETEDKGIIEFLTGNTNWQEVKSVKEKVIEKIEEVLDIQVEKPKTKKSLKE